MIFLSQIKKIKGGGESTTVDQETKQAQAQLRGSVGGVTGILQVQESYSNGNTDYNSAITIFIEIYGFTREVADALLGSPEKQETNESTAEPI